MFGRGVQRVGAAPGAGGGLRAGPEGMLPPIAAVAEAFGHGPIACTHLAGFNAVVFQALSRGINRLSST